MALPTESRAASACSYSNIPEVHVEDPPTEDIEASTQELRLGYTGQTSGISFRALATTALILGVTVASLTWTMFFGSSPSESLINADGGDGPMMIGLAEAANTGDIRIRVCRNEDCDKDHPHGLVHEYIANLNTCATIPENTPANKTNGEYTIVGATAATLANGTKLTAKQCGNMTRKVFFGPFSLIVGAFTECCSFRHGGCGFKCITYKQASGGPVANGTVPDNSTAAAKNGTTAKNATTTKMADNATQKATTTTGNWVLKLTTTVAAGATNATSPTSTAAAKITITSATANSTKVGNATNTSAAANSTKVGNATNTSAASNSTKVGNATNTSAVANSTKVGNASNTSAAARI